MSASYTQNYQNESAASDYDERIYRPSSHDALMWEVEQRVLDRLLREHVPGATDALDFACGTGRILEYLRPRVGKLTGVDVSDAMLQRARAKVPDAELICANIAENPDAVAGGRDLITSFRFLLLAEPALRTACIRALAGKLKTGGVMILNSHGNKWSYRLLAELRNRLFRSRKPHLNWFCVRDMKHLAEQCGLRLTHVTGLGFVPPSLVRILPGIITRFIERVLADRPLIWRFGTNLLFVLEANFRVAADLR